jgi:glycosyltransferase involved in cell wall biosynthesis
MNAYNMIDCANRDVRRKRLLWLTWEDHRRSRSLARVLDAELCELASTLGRPRPVRYILNVYNTVRLLARRRPDTVICQLPSSVLALLTILLRSPFGYRLGLDAHNAGLAVDPDSSAPMRWLAGWLQRRADFVIVHNAAIEALARSRGGTLVSLPDPLPTLAMVAPLKMARPFNLLFVCTFSPDEPYLAVLEAARLIDPDIGIYVTGSPPPAIARQAWPDNVVFCGRVPWERYDQLLHSVNGVIDLTTRERCLVCGAYEAVAAGKPMILSRTGTLMSYFSRGAVFTDNQVSGSPHSICRTILELRSREAELRAEVAVLRRELTQDWDKRLQMLLLLV